MLNASIKDIPMPPRMARRPISDKGFPVPWFVAKVDGQWDFRVVDTPKLPQAVKRGLCWLCGEPLGQYLCFVIGPMCAINRASSEPPSHRDCAEYAVKACPFLSKPNMRRNKNFDFEPVGPAGVGVAHNPGVTLLWITKGYRPFRANGGVLFEIGDPLETYFYREGRTATRDEILAAIDKGLPILRQMAAEENAMPELQAQIDRAMTLIPA
ncbi:MULTISPECIES: hypothetical protein [unclassified Bradyrhizobium]|uniref:hypothetical protein n=1 Tax=unclassified Bradyrhizobium TaxID=2631580 RepID=UPI002FEF19E3